MLPEITRLRAEVENLRRVRDAAINVVAAGRREGILRDIGPAMRDLRAALDAAKENP